MIQTFVRSLLPPPAPQWMASDYQPKHAAHDPLPTAVDPALRWPPGLELLAAILRVEHDLIGGAR